MVVKFIWKYLGFLMIGPAWGQMDYPVHPVPFTSVKVSDQFWSPRLQINREITIPASFEQCRSTGRIRNFQMAASKSGKFCTAYPFDDTDIYKTLEGASYSLAVHPDADLERYLDSLISLIEAAQEPDGYLYTARTIDPLHPPSWSGNTRWINEHNNSHELYNAGHLYEAAVAHYMATGKRNLLNLAIKNANLLLSVFGPDKLHVAPGHEIVEMGLVKLYRITGNRNYLQLAKFFLEQRGERIYDKTSKNVWENGAYWQAQKPVTQQNEVVGHAVRAMYLYAAMTDIAALTGDRAYEKAVDQLWENMVGQKMYIHGGIGAVGDGERFGENYELPNLTAYAETCAAIGSVFWNFRMFLLHGESKYIDVLEKTMYNGLLSGVGLDGKSFFYTNTLQIKNGFTHPDQELARSGWFTCSCCPTNITRLIPSVPGYIYAWKENSIYVNLFISGVATVAFGHNQTLRLKQESNYPWDGHIRITLGKPPAGFVNLLIRLPGWSRDEAMPGGLYRFDRSEKNPISIRVNQLDISFEVTKGYAVLHRKWKEGDQVELELPMPVQKVVADPKLRVDSGMVALQRGPILYCAEAIDNGGATSQLVIPRQLGIKAIYRADLLHGVMTLESEVTPVEKHPDESGTLSRNRSIFAVPYYAWANRGKGEMNIWFPYK